MAAVALGYNFKSFMPINLEWYEKEYGINNFKDKSYKNISLIFENKVGLCKDQKGESLRAVSMGEAFFKEIVSVYLNNWLGKLISPQKLLIIRLFISLQRLAN